MFVTADDNKTSNKHVEAGINVVLGRGFNSRRLHSTRPSTASLMAGRTWRVRLHSRQATFGRVECPEVSVLAHPRAFVISVSAIESPATLTCPAVAKLIQLAIARNPVPFAKSTRGPVVNHQDRAKTAFLQ